MVRLVKEASMMWDGSLRGRRTGDTLHVGLDEIGDLQVRFGRLWATEKLETLQAIGKEMAIALDVIPADFKGRILICNPSPTRPDETS